MDAEIERTKDPGSNFVARSGSASGLGISRVDATVIVRDTSDTTLLAAFEPWRRSVDGLMDHTMTAADSRIDPAAMTNALDGLHRPSGRTARLRADPITITSPGARRPSRPRASGACPAGTCYPQVPTNPGIALPSGPISTPTGRP